MELNVMEGLTIGSVAAVPIVVALVQLFKMTLPNAARFAPFVSIGLGILIAFLANADTMELHETILAGILYGLSASGLYSATKATANTINKDNGQDDLV